jgi:hypothetical protein
MEELGRNETLRLEIASNPLELEKGMQRFYVRRVKQFSEPQLEAEFATLAA